MKASPYLHNPRNLFFVKPFLFCLLILSFLPLQSHAQERPKVLLMLAEQQIGQEALLFWWDVYAQASENIGTVTSKGNVAVLAQQTDLSIADTTMKEELMNYDFELVDASAVSKNITVSPAYKVADITKAAALQMGKDVNADIVIKGKVLAKTTGSVSGSNVITYTANISATAIRVSDGRVMAAGRASGVARHISEDIGGSKAIENATLKLSEKLGKKIEDNWAK